MPSNEKNYSKREHGKLAPANTGRFATPETDRVQIAPNRTDGTPEFFLDGKKHLSVEDGFALTSGKDRAPKIGYFQGVDFDADGRIRKDK